MEWTGLPVRRNSGGAVSWRDATTVLWPDYVMRKPWCCFASLTNLSCWRTPSGIWAISILSRDAQIWRSLVTTRHLDFIGDMNLIRRWVWRTLFGVSRFSDGSKREHYGKRCATFIRV